MARVKHPVIDGLVMDVPDGRLDEWVAAGWVEDRPDNNNEAGPAGEED